jgi:hypothetical protein
MRHTDVSTNWSRPMSKDLTWQPIETAPKDQPILMWLIEPVDRRYPVAKVFDDLDHLAIGFWVHDHWCSLEIEDCGSMGGEMTGWMEDWEQIRVNPSHWMPLPEPPK